MSGSDDTRSERERSLALADFLSRRGGEIVDEWVRLQAAGVGSRGPIGDVSAVTRESEALIGATRDALLTSARLYDPTGPEFEPLRALIVESSRRGVRQGSTPAETAHAVLALREAATLVLETEADGPALRDAVVTFGRLVDSLALLTFEAYVASREQVIIAQSHQLTELSTPVVRVWDGVVAAPLIGTLDSARAQVVMETLLQSIVDENARIAIVDITGVPTFDTLVAQNLLKTVTATRLMGADCIISGIRPQTAQTIVQLGIDLTEITTRATLADALVTAIDRVGHNDSSHRPANR